MTTIGIVGAGVASLQLGLYLRQRGIDATIYAERSAGETLASRLQSMVARHHFTRERERALGVNFWDASAHANLGRVHVDIMGEQPLHFKGHLDRPSITVDMRIYTARLLEEFAARGGKAVIKAVEAAELDALAAQHDLLVVAAGRGGMGALFPRIAEHSPYATPQRSMAGALFRGIDPGQPSYVNFTIVPGMGEIFCMPIYTFEPGVVALLIEAVPGSPLDALARVAYDADPAAFNAGMLDLMRRYAPPVAARIDPARFAATRSLDVVQGAITPVVRKGYARLPGGRLALALGDAHVLNDPILGQGANNASNAAFVLGEAIAATRGAGAGFDEAFCRAVEERTWAYSGPVTAWNNVMLQPPPAHMLEFMVAASMHPSVGNAFASFLISPVEGWETFSSPERTATLLRGHGWQGMPQPMAAAAD